MQTLNRRHILAAGALGGVALLGGGIARAQTRNVIDTLAADGRFNRFLELVGRGGATDQFRGAGPITLFAPTDAAFDGPGGLRTQELLAEGGSGGSGGGSLAASPDPIRLRAFIGYYVLAGQALYGAQLTGDQQVKTVAGGVLRINATSGRVLLSNPAPQQPGTFGAGGLNVEPPAALAGPEIIATNGVIHPITALLFP